MNRNHLERIAEENWRASWAIWSPDFPDSGCIEESPEEVYDYFLNNVDSLNPEVVFLSLNPSEDIYATFANFRSISPEHYDYRLKNLIQDNDLEQLQGGYMTDLVRSIYNPDSAEVEPDKDDLERFLSEITSLGEDAYHVICFLEDVFEPIRKYFDASPRELEHDIRSFSADWEDIQLNLYRVYFYGNWGANTHLVPKLEEQLSYLNEYLTENTA